MESDSAASEDPSPKLTWYPLNGTRESVLGELHDAGVVGFLHRMLQLPTIWRLRGANLAAAMPRFQYSSARTAFTFSGIFTIATALGVDYRKPLEPIVAWVQNRQLKLHGRKYEGRPEEDAAFWSLLGMGAHVFLSRNGQSSWLGRGIQLNARNIIILSGGAFSMGAFANLAHAIWYYKLSNQPESANALL